MLLYSKTAPPKAPKRRSRAGCINCKEKKKKCNEERPQCDRCTERDLTCKYEAVKPRQRRTSKVISPSTPLVRDTCHSRTWPHGLCNAPTENKLSIIQSPPQDSWSLSLMGDHDFRHDFDVFSQSYQSPPMDEDGVEEIVRESLSDHRLISYGTMPSCRSGYMDLATIAPSPLVSPLFEFCAPAFQEFSDCTNRRALVDHFCNVLSHLVVFKEDMGNPFTQLVLPLAYGNSPVMNAIYALSSAHLEYRGIENKEKSLSFHNRALQGLAGLIEENNPSRSEEILGAIMLLVYYEVLVQSGNSNIVQGHLKGAMTIMSHASSPSETSQFLERAFGFYDVISALSWGTSPLRMSPSTAKRESATPFSSLNPVDTLLGMATDLWPIIHRLSDLLTAKNEINAAMAVGNLSKATVLRTELESTSCAIELALSNWMPAVPESWYVQLTSSSASSPSIDLDGYDFESKSIGPPAEKARLQSILNNAEAYRHAALVYLYRYIRCLPRLHEKVQRHCGAALSACGKVVEWGGPMGALLWPLFMAACEAVDPSDRELALAAFRGTEKRQGMTNITRAREVVEEVWRNDASGIEVCWRDVCKDKGYNIVFG